MVSDGIMGRGGGARAARQNTCNSETPEGNVFQSIDARRHVFRISKLRNGVFVDAASAIASGKVSGEAAVDDTFARQTVDISDARER
jgi:hypothetical protein